MDPREKERKLTISCLNITLGNATKRRRRTSCYEAKIKGAADKILMQHEKCLGFLNIMGDMLGDKAFLLDAESKGIINKKEKKYLEELSRTFKDIAKAMNDRKGIYYKTIDFARLAAENPKLAMQQYRKASPAT